MNLEVTELLCVTCISRAWLAMFSFISRCPEDYTGDNCELGLSQGLPPGTSKSEASENLGTELHGP